MADPTSNLTDDQLREMLAQIAQLLSQQHQLTTLGTPNPLFGQVKDVVGGPGIGNPAAPTAAPQGVLFAGGSPYKPNFGPARLQNSLVAIRDLLTGSSQFANSPLGQALGAKLKGLFNGS